MFEELPLSIRNATLVSGTPKGLGQYERRIDRVFTPDEPVTVYAELYGYGVTSKANGGYVRALNADLALVDSTGAVRANQIGFWSSSEEFEIRPLEMHLQSLVAHLVYGTATEMTRRSVRARFDGGTPDTSWR